MGKVMRHTLGASLNIRHNLSSSKGPKPLQLKLLTTYIPKTSAFTLAFSTSQRLRTTRARHDGGYYTVKDCVTIDVLPRTPGNNVYVGFMVWSNFTATKCRGLVSLNQVIKEIICLQP